MFIILPFYFFKFRGSRVIITVIPKGRNCDPQKRERRERETDRDRQNEPGKITGIHWLLDKSFPCSELQLTQE